MPVIAQYPGDGDRQETEKPFTPISIIKRLAEKPFGWIITEIQMYQATSEREAVFLITVEEQVDSDECGEQVGLPTEE